jgi:hypothetical protein
MFLVMSARNNSQSTLRGRPNTKASQIFSGAHDKMHWPYAGFSW